MKGTKQGIELPVRLKPRSSGNKVQCERNGVLICSVTAPPVDGKANDALMKLLSGYFGVPKKAFALKSGKSSRNKVILIREPFASKLFPSFRGADNPVRKDR